MTYPVVMTFREGGETYSVDASGAIGRPAIKMAPSGGWRFVGLVNSRGGFVCHFLDLLCRLQRGDGMPHAPHVRDLDHGTMRDHGHAVDWFRLEPGADLEECREIARQRAASEEKAREAANDARNALAARGATIWADSRYPVALVELRGLKGARFVVTDDGIASDPMTADAAGRSLGAAVMFHATQEESE